MTDAPDAPERSAMQRRRFVATVAGAIGLAPLASCIADI